MPARRSSRDSTLASIVSIRPNRFRSSRDGSGPQGPAVKPGAFQGPRRTVLLWDRPEGWAEAEVAIERVGIPPIPQCRSLRLPGKSICPASRNLKASCRWVQRIRQ